MSSLDPPHSRRSAPLMVWLLGRDVSVTDALTEELWQDLRSETLWAESFHVFGMLDMMAISGDVRLYAQERQLLAGRRRRDMDCLAALAQEKEFLHQLFCRLSAPAGFRTKDAVLLFGNLLLPRLARFQRRFRVRLLQVDASDLSRVGQKLGAPIEQLAPRTAVGLRAWLETALAEHARHTGCVSCGDGLLQDDFFSLSRATVALQPERLRALTAAGDGALWERCLCRIPPLRSDEPEPSSSEDEDEGRAQKRPKAAELTQELLTAWAKEHLRPERNATLQWTALKRALAAAFQQKPSNNMLAICGLRPFPSNSKNYVRDIDDNRLEMVP